MVTNSHEPHKAYGVPELSRAWGVSKMHLYHLIAAGELPAFRIGKRIVVPADEVARFEREHRVSTHSDGAPPTTGSTQVALPLISSAGGRS